MRWRQRRAYGYKSCEGKFQNIIWRDKKAVTCPDCLARLADNEVSIVLEMESAITYKSMPSTATVYPGKVVEIEQSLKGEKLRNFCESLLSKQDEKE